VQNATLLSWGGLYTEKQRNGMPISGSKSSNEASAPRSLTRGGRVPHRVKERIDSARSNDGQAGGFKRGVIRSEMGVC